MAPKKARLRVPVNPALLRWARERAALPLGKLVKRFPPYERWEQGTAQPTLKQLEHLAQALHVPIGYLFLNEPPEEPLPIPDFRTMPGHPERPSPDLLDTLYLCQQRQAWYRDYLTRLGSQPLPFVGSVTLQHNPSKWPQLSASVLDSTPRNATPYPPGPRPCAALLNRWKRLAFWSW